MYRTSNKQRIKRGRRRMSTHRWGRMMNMTPLWTQQKQWLLPIAHLHPHLDPRAPGWRRIKSLTLLKVTHDYLLLFPSLFFQMTDMIELIWSTNNTELWTVCEGEFGRSCGREEVPGMCAAIVSRVLMNREERLPFSFFIFFCNAVCFDPINHKNTVAPHYKTNKSKEREKKKAFACIKSPQYLTVQFQQREYFMTMKHLKVAGVIKA